MATFRVNKTKDYTVMSNNHLRDMNLTLKAKGLLSMMLSLPEDWNYSVEGLKTICKENETAIKSALKELKKFGYLVITKQMPTKENGGKYEYVYNIYEVPQKAEKQDVENQGIENQGVENQPIENHPLYKILNKQNTDKQNTEEEKRKKEERKRGYDEILSVITDSDLRDLYLEYIKMRKLIKSPMTDKALSMLINRVNKIEPHSIERQKQMLETAIMNNWKSVYPIKDEETKSEESEPKRYGGTYL